MTGSGSAFTLVLVPLSIADLFGITRSGTRATTLASILGPLRTALDDRWKKVPPVFLILIIIVVLLLLGSGYRLTRGGSRSRWFRR